MKRIGSEEVDCRILLYPRYSTPRFSLSPALLRVLGGPEAVYGSTVSAESTEGYLAGEDPNSQGKSKAKSKPAPDSRYANEDEQSTKRPAWAHGSRIPRESLASVAQLSLSEHLRGKAAPLLVGRSVSVAAAATRLEASAREASVREGSSEREGNDLVESGTGNVVNVNLRAPATRE